MNPPSSKSCTPPQEASAVVRPQGKKIGSDIIGGRGFARYHRTQGPQLLSQAGLVPNARVIACLSGSMQDRPDRVDRIRIAIRREDLIRMDRQQIGQFPLILHGPHALRTGEDLDQCFLRPARVHVRQDVVLFGKTCCLLHDRQRQFPEDRGGLVAASLLEYSADSVNACTHQTSTSPQPIRVDYVLADSRQGPVLSRMIS